MSPRRVAWAALFALLPAVVNGCTREKLAPEDGAAPLATLASAPANAWLSASWERDALPGLRRSLVERFGRDGGLPSLLSLPSGRCSFLAPKQRGTAFRVALQAFVRDGTESAERLLDVIDPARFVTRHGEGGTTIEARSLPEGYVALERSLETLSWFRAAESTFATKAQEDAPRLFTAAFDVGEALRMVSRIKGRGPFGVLAAALPGMAGFRSLVVDVRGDAEPEFMRMVVGFSRTRVGFAKALDVEAAPLRFEAALRAVAEPKSLSYSIQRLDVGVLVDSLGLAAGVVQLGPFGPNPLAMLRSMRVGKVLTRQFWSGFGKEFALVGRESEERVADFCVLAQVRDRDAVRKNFTEIFGEDGVERVIGAEGQELERFTSRRLAVFENFELVVLLGETSAAVTSAGFEELARGLLGRAPSQDAPAGPARNLYARIGEKLLRMPTGLAVQGRRVPAGLDIEARRFRR